MAATSYWILIYTILVTVLGLSSSLSYSKIVFFKWNSFETFFLKWLTFLVLCLSLQVIGQCGELMNGIRERNHTGQGKRY